MIKINLLPYRIARKKENIRRQVSIFFGLVVLALTCMLYAWISLSIEIAALDKDVKAAKAELLTYQETIRKAKEHQKTIERVKNKMEVIKKLVIPKDQQHHPHQVDNKHEMIAEGGRFPGLQPGFLTLKESEQTLVKRFAGDPPVFNDIADQTAD